MKPLKFFEQLGSVEKFRNMINVGRGAISYVNLEQDDPPSKRPACLFVSSLTSSSYTSSQVSKFSCKRRIVHFSFLLLLVFKINAMLVAFLVTFSKMWPLFWDVQSLYVQMKYFSSKCSFYSYLKKAFWNIFDGRLTSRKYYVFQSSTNVMIGLKFFFFW